MLSFLLLLLASCTPGNGRQWRSAVDSTVRGVPILAPRRSSLIPTPPCTAIFSARCVDMSPRGVTPSVFGLYFDSGTPYWRTPAHKPHTHRGQRLRRMPHLSLVAYTGHNTHTHRGQRLRRMPHLLFNYYYMLFQQQHRPQQHHPNAISSQCRLRQQVSSPSCQCNAPGTGQRAMLWHEMADRMLWHEMAGRM